MEDSTNNSPLIKEEKERLHFKAESEVEKPEVETKSVEKDEKKKKEKKDKKDKETNEEDKKEKKKKKDKTDEEPSEETEGGKEKEKKKKPKKDKDEKCSDLGQLNTKLEKINGKIEALLEKKAGIVKQIEEAQDKSHVAAEETKDVPEQGAQDIPTEAKVE